MGNRWDRRQHWWVAVVAFAVTAAATFTAALTGSSGSADPTGPTQVAAAPTAAPRSPLDIGLAYGDELPFLSDQDLAAALDDTVRAGGKWVRADLSWEDIQPDSPAKYQWNRFDRVVKAARKRGLQVLAVVAYTPPWARPAKCRNSQSCEPADPAAFARFAGQATSRYAPMGVHTWEIWNEPNIGFWKPKPDPVRFTELLRQTTKSMHRADPKATLLMGGLAAVDDTATNSRMGTSAFLRAVSKLGANKLVDGIAYHPYTYPYLPSARTAFGTAWEKISNTTDNLVSILSAYGTPDLPIWITETGAPTNGPGVASDGVTIPTNTTHVTEGFQAKIAADTIPTAARNRHIAAVFWFTDRDTTTDRSQRWKFFGLRRIDGSAKPAFAAFRQAVNDYEKSLKQSRQ